LITNKPKARTPAKNKAVAKRISSAPKILRPAKVGKVTRAVARAAVKFVMDRRGIN